MAKLIRRERITKLARASAATVAATIAAIIAATMAFTACSASSPEAAQTTTTITVSAPNSSAPVTSNAPASPSAPATSAPASTCAVNPSTAPVPTVGPYETVPEDGRISVALSGIPAGTVTPGGAPTEVDVTLCNDSAVNYPEVGVVVMLGNCSCVPDGLPIAKGTVERFDDGTGTWMQMEHPAMGTGMDYLGGYSIVLELPKGKTATVRYRIALDASMTTGEGSVEAAAVTPEPLNQLGNASVPFTVVN